MALEIAGAVLLGAFVLWLVFEPMLAPGGGGADFPEPPALEETRHGAALLALKEIEFDRETGKLSDTDYDALKARYGAEALATMPVTAPQGNGAERRGPADPEALIAARLQQLRAAPSAGQPAPAACPTCGPRAEPDAVFCSSCGRSLAAAAFCSSCGTAVKPGSRFCAGCGTRVAA
jgi:hypothetical protein